MWIFIIVLVALAVADYALTPGPPKNETTPGIVNAATATAGGSIPLLFGTRELTSPNVVWFGDVATSAIKSSSGKK